MHDHCAFVRARKGTEWDATFTAQSIAALQSCSVLLGTLSLTRLLHFEQCGLPAQVPDGLKEILGPDAPDVCIEAVGLHYIRSWLHKVEHTLMLETDTSEILNEIIYCCRKVISFLAAPVQVP